MRDIKNIKQRLIQLRKDANRLRMLKENGYKLDREEVNKFFEDRKVIKQAIYKIKLTKELTTINI